LFKYEHINQEEEPHFHYSTCYDCEQRYGDLHDATKCAYCRKPSTKKFPSFFVDNHLVVTRFYDDSSIAIAISSMSMAALSWCHGRIHEQNATILDIKTFNQNTWMFLSIVSFLFVCHVRKSVSILFDYRGLAFLLLPILNAIIAQYDSDMASSISMSTLLSIFVQLLSTKKSFIISDRFYQYMSFFPERLLCINHRQHQLEQFQGRARINAFKFNLGFYMILWATIAAAQSHHKICKNNELYCKGLFFIMRTETGFIVFSSITIFLLFVIKMMVYYTKKTSVFNYNEGLWILVIKLIMNLTKGTEMVFRVVDVSVMLPVFFIYMFIVYTIIRYIISSMLHWIRNEL
jgi:hypothetical protein